MLRRHTNAVALTSFPFFVAMLADADRTRPTFVICVGCVLEYLAKELRCLLAGFLIWLFDSFVSFWAFVFTNISIFECLWGMFTNPSGCMSMFRRHTDVA